MNVFTKINRIKWKYVVGANLAVVVLAGVIVTSTKPTQTDNRSQAAEPVAAPLNSIRIDPNNPPQLISPDPDWAKVGDATVVNGKNLGNIPFGTLWIGEVKIPYENIIDWQPNQIVFTVPPDAVTGPIMLTVNQNSFKTKTSLTIRNTNP